MASAPSPAAETPAAAPSVLADPRDRFFCTDAVTKDLKRRTIRGGAVTLSAQGVKFGLRLGSTAVLARLLTPADFGLIAMVTVITGFVEMFKDAGLSMATIQRERITHAQVSTLFWINVALSALIMLVIAALAPAIAWFYGEPRLLPITLALSGTMIFGGLAVQHQALLRRQMQFGRLAAIEITSMAAGVAAAILMAYNNYTYWSLVAMTAATAATTALMSFIMSGWLPGLPVRGSGVREMLKFGGNLAGYQAINYFCRNTDNILVGSYWGPAILGAYSKAYSLLLLPWQQLLAPIHSVVQPALCRLRDTPHEYRKYYRHSLGVVAWTSFAALAFSCTQAEILVRLVMGPQWDAVVPLFILLSPAAAVLSIRTATAWVYTSHGHVRRQLRYSLASGILLITAVAVACPYGAEYVATMVSVIQVLQFILSIPICFHKTFMRVTDATRALLPPLVSAASFIIIFCILTTHYHCGPTSASLIALGVYAILALTYVYCGLITNEWSTAQ